MSLIFLVKESWLCKIKRKHCGQWPRKPWHDIEASVWLWKSRFASNTVCKTMSMTRATGMGFFQHERLQSWRSSTDSRLQPAALLHAGALTYICGSHKGEKGALFPVCRMTKFCMI